MSSYDVVAGDGGSKLVVTITDRTSKATVDRRMRMARAFLSQRLMPEALP